MVTVVSADNVYLCMHRQTYAYLATKLSYCAFQLYSVSSYSMDVMFYYFCTFPPKSIKPIYNF